MPRDESADRDYQTLDFVLTGLAIMLTAFAVVAGLTFVSAWYDADFTITESNLNILTAAIGSLFMSTSLLAVPRLRRRLRRSDGGVGDV